MDELQRVVDYLDKVLPSNAIVFLRGDLAAGKTTLTQAIAKAKGVMEEVTSPTFSLQHCYEGREGKDLYHYDLYRTTYEEFMKTGLVEEFEKPGWHLVEWGCKRLKDFLQSIGYDVFTIEIEPREKSRIYRMEA